MEMIIGLICGAAVAAATWGVWHALGLGDYMFAASAVLGWLGYLAARAGFAQRP